MLRCAANIFKSKTFRCFSSKSLSKKLWKLHSFFIYTLISLKKSDVVFTKHDKIFYNFFVNLSVREASAIKLTIVLKLEFKKIYIPLVTDRVAEIRFSSTRNQPKNGNKDFILFFLQFSLAYLMIFQNFVVTSLWKIIKYGKTFLKNEEKPS